MIGRPLGSPVLGTLMIQVLGAESSTTSRQQDRASQIISGWSLYQQAKAEACRTVWHLFLERSPEVTWTPV